MDVPVKPISAIEVKEEVSENDKILILDSSSNEARLASKEELRGEKWDTWPQGIKGDTWDKWDKGDKGDKWDKGDKGDTWSQGIQGIQGEKGDKGDKGDTWNGIVDITTTTSWKVHTVKFTDSEGNVYFFQVMDWYDGTGAWDMVKATYDPNGIEGDAFDYNNFLNTPTVNTRQFILPSLSSLTVAQEIYEYALWGNGAVIRYNNEDYFLAGYDNNDPIFLRTKIESATSNDWTNTYMKDTGLKFTIVNANVTAISVVNNTNPWYLATGVNYATPYTPEYEGSPATKQYVDNSISSASIQVSTLPTASSSNVGTIYQYVGTTTSSYTNGYFYQCIENSGTYSWEEVKLQDGEGIKIFWWNNLTTLWGEFANWLNDIEYDGSYAKFQDCEVVYNGVVYTRATTYSENSGNYVFRFTKLSAQLDNYNGGYSKAYTPLIRFTCSYSGGTWAFVSADSSYNYSITQGYLRTDFNYSTPYTPEYPWSPATKKYVDDQKVELKTIEEYRNLTPTTWKLYLIYEKQNNLKEFSELQTMTVSDVVTELNTKATEYYDKFEGEQRMMDYNSQKYFCQTSLYLPYEWTWWSVYYNTSTEVWALDSWE